MNTCLLIPILTGLISALLGYLLGRLLGGEGNNDRVAQLEADLEACRASKSANLASSFAAGATAIAFDADAAKAIFGKKIKENDLTIVEGIGPKIQELFHNHGVHTWRELSQCSQEKCQSVLDSGGERYKIHKPGTWPEQARLAYEGQWQKLWDWQEELDGGV
ncbi:hypothetical protein RM697_06030 [Ichthyenterobacterium sp. W332]|uniref:LSU ribosomal protein L21p n=1 Tax=Microcosmobacter mediterraneus TaxID=3075607 RepID=A0ABU2YM96_9FLAO|nr:hypothetical protein [Ichthyenterobacterium sp. W332]MDT0558193.1 hypothetical protein [Ichthyenterobacterium sp. W332]